MKLIAVETARAIWLFPLQELNPAGLSLTEVFASFTERYSFKKSPKHMLDLDDEKSLTFAEGEFKTSNGIEISIKLKIYTDGFVADCWSSTKDSQEFLEDAMRWLKADYGLGLPDDRSIKNLNLSALTVTTDKKLVSLNPKLTSFVDELTARVGNRYGDNTGFNVGGISIESNEQRRPNAPPPFRFENKAGSSPSEKRYFTQAALPTDAHLELLEKFENILD